MKQQTACFLGNRRGISFRMLILVMTIFVSTVAWSQKVMLTGTVKDDSGSSLPGVTVVIKGTTNGTVTDINGSFSINTNVGEILKISFVGYTSQEIQVSADISKLDIVLESDMIGLEEVVAIGYGTIKKGDVTSAVSSVKADDFIQGSVKDAAQLVQGKVAGLSISLPSGDPTKGASMMMRGVSSLMGNRTPLVLVDGVPGSLETVAPEDIESVDVLKDGSATAIYGTRGTNGVIIITTKSGKLGMKPTIEYSGYVSLSQISNKLDFLDADELREKWAEGYSFNGSNVEDFGSDTDWLDEITRSAVSHVHNVVFRGGNETTSLTASVNYKDNQGIFINSDNQKYTGRVEVTHNMFDNKLKTNIGILASEQKYWTGGDGYSFNNYVYRQAIIRNPTEPIKNEDGSWYERDVYFYDNPVAYIKESIGENKYRNLRFNASMVYTPIEGVDLKAMYARKGNSNIRGYYQTKNHVSNTKYGNGGYASRGTDDYVGNYGELSASLKKSIGAHRFTALVGYNYEDNTYQNFWANNKYFPSDAYTYNSLGIGKGLGEGEAGMGSGKSTDKLIAFYSRVSYSLADKYLLMVSLRREGSSRFGENYKWGNFPGVSAGWRINQEAFMQDIEWIDNLKLRAGFGVTGINVDQNLVSLSGLKYDEYFLYNGSWVRDLIPSRNDNPDLKWEKKEEINIGLDFDLFDGRLGGAVDYYSRKTKDALWDYDVPEPPYLYGSILANVGVIENKGFEALLNVVPVKTSNFKWNANFTYSTNKNKLASLSNDKFQTTNEFFYRGYTGEPIQIETHRIDIGGPIGNFYGLRSVDISEDGIWIIENADGERKLATESSTEDRQILGNGLPKHYLSLNNTFNYKGFDLNVNLRAALDFQIINFQRMFYENPTVSYNVLDSAFDKVYGKAVLSDVQRYVSYYVEDGDYLKIDNITLGYNFKTNKIKGIEKLRVYVSGMNLFTFTGYKGIDPEVNRIGSSSDEDQGLAPGIDHRDQYPTTRSFTFGVNVTL
ncbi:SusC/RagA family TonB-linked outer membrane protein [Plebeiibacterium marinum]|uniref:TonB-dependent receptor n=1 Tax=Plebeiibacterium marinum TaxID=2992111 RepID=A0AAE3SLL1_9BACT|nr:TonB-dependent receptor [Plebeiobacterium marinum]MCW3807980.1 TonB-dependent receptor [Plebeiobacterium marinum]